MANYFPFFTVERSLFYSIQIKNFIELITSLDSPSVVFFCRFVLFNINKNFPGTVIIFIDSLFFFLNCCGATSVRIYSHGNRRVMRRTYVFFVCSVCYIDRITRRTSHRSSSL